MLLQRRNVLQTYRLFLVIGFKVSMRLFILTNIWGRFGIFWCMYVKFIQYNQMSHIFLGRRRNYSQSNSWCCDVSQMCFDDITGVQKGFQWYYYKMYFNYTVLNYNFGVFILYLSISRKKYRTFIPLHLLGSWSYFTDEYFRWLDDYCTYKT